jgi:Acyl-CoA reductase (LuxC)
MLAQRPVRSILRAVAGAAERWSDADFPPRVRCLDAIGERTGYSLPVIEYALDRLFVTIGERALEEAIAGELGSLDVLDQFVERPGGGTARALPAGRVCVISSRTTIGVAILPSIFALCAKCHVLVKDREDGLVAAFFASLSDELDEMREAARAQTWDGERDARDLATFDVVAAFGDDATLARIRAPLPPATRFVVYGSKASFGYVGRDALADTSAARRVAEGAARDAVLYDGEGCLSLHGLFVERGAAVSPEAFAALLAAAVERAVIEFPAGAPRMHALAGVSGARDLAAFRAAGGTGAVYSDARASYLVTLDPPNHEAPAFLPRALAVRGADGPGDLAAYLERHRIPLEAIAIAGSRADIMDMATSTGAARIAAFGHLQSPPLGAAHGGRPRIAEFVRWMTRDP